MSKPPSIQKSDAKARRTFACLGQQLPVRPGPLLDLLACDDKQPQQVAAIIERDPAMAARVLGMVNSAGNRRLHEVTSVSRAVLQLGGASVRTLGLAMGMQGLAEQFSLPPKMLSGFWNASIRKAEAAHLAVLVIDPDRQSSAYSAGLIADVGLPLLMALDPDFYEDQMPLRSSDQSCADAERAHFGIDHAQAGAHALQQWKVSSDTCRRVRSHHQLPSEETDAALTLALYIAGLLPHDDGEMDPIDLNRLMAVHGRVLSAAYATPDTFLGHVYTESQSRMTRDSVEDENVSMEMQPFLDAIAANTIAIVSQMCEMHHAKDKHQEDISTLRFEAFTDPLTKVLNRRGFFGLAEQRIAKHADGVGTCCMMLDLNGFKPVNDQYGHEAGDLMLRGLAKLLRRSVARHDIIGRLGGDEFVILLTEVDEAGARSASGRLSETCLGKRIRVSSEHTIELSFSVGVAFHPAVGPELKLDQLLAAADELMYQCKRSRTPGLIFSDLSASGESAFGGLPDGGEDD